MKNTVLFAFLVFGITTLFKEPLNAQPMIQAPFLKSGDTICVVAPAGVVDVSKTKAGLALWEKQGYHVKVGKNVYAQNNRFAGTDSQRLADLQSALNDASCKAIVCVRGGHGSIHLLDKLDFTSFRKNPKWLIGFSDITVLHEEFQRQGYMSIHGPMIASSIIEERPSASFNYLMQMLRGNIPSYQFAAHPLNRLGTCTGELIGGNLSVIYSLLGNSKYLQTDGKILFIEDLGEQLYHLDRMMYALKISGKLKQVKALLVGEFIEMKDSGNMKQSVEEIILNAVSQYNFPVYFNFPAGHDKNNYPLLFGKKYQLESSTTQVTLKPIN
ncbi:MAG: LD-carboxypeptidase [Mangrovibacterium sp.]